MRSFALAILVLTLACDQGVRTQGGSRVLTPSGDGTPAAKGSMGAGSVDTATNPPMKPLTTPSEQPAGDIPETIRTCNADSDCSETYPHCVKDVANEVGICTKECTTSQSCGTIAYWVCLEARWTLGSDETKNLCAPTCVLNVDCPRGTSCNEGFCGTPCVGGNCGAHVEACQSHTSVDCVGDAVYWYNSCFEPETVKEACAQGQTCLWGVCIDTQTQQPSHPVETSGDGTCTGEVARCVGGQTVTIEDSCGKQVRSQTCTGGQECSAGTCRCMPSSQTRCDGDKLWRLDSCGNTKSMIGPC